ncbi:MAG TPA: type II secretion system protein GspK [Spirochaetota bacterium]|nr:type II secretion system protein GspK [Spirochaetota bacterium]
MRSLRLHHCLTGTNRMINIKKHISQIRQMYRQRAAKLEKHGLFGSNEKNRGFVLIIVLIVSTLLISVSTDFLVSAQNNINYMIKFKNEAQAEAAAQAALNIAHIILDIDQKGVTPPMIPVKNKDKNIDTFGDIWAFDFPEFELANATVKIIIEDEQSKINLSAIATEYVPQTTFFGIINRFFMNMGFPMDYADAVADWVDRDNSRTGNGAETYDHYSTLQTPYSAANAPLESIDRLLLVRYFSPAIYYGFSGGNMAQEKEEGMLVESNDEIMSLDVLSIMESVSDDSEETTEEEESGESEEEDIPIGPESSRRLDKYLRVNGDPKLFNSQVNKININTAPYRVLRSIAPDMTDNDAKQIILRRRINPFKKVDDVKEFIRDDLIRRNCLTVNSNLFRITVHAYVNRHKVTITAIYDRSLKYYSYYALH